MRKYTKSVGQAKRERQRRALVLKLIESGLTQREVAKRLAVSEKTVSRDLAKLRCWRTQQAAQRRREIEKLFSGLLAKRPKGLRYLWVGEGLAANLAGDKVSENRLIKELLEGSYR
jgi:IS30 family transposase